MTAELTTTLAPQLRADGAVGTTPVTEHVVIEGDNLDVLPLLHDTHAGHFDLVYIDPPYNTGNREWGYNDTFDTSEQMGWFDFMHSRLEEAYGLMKDTGVIMASIGPAEHHRLRLLLDEVYGPENFIGEAVWDGSGSQLSRGLSGGIDFLIFYAKDKEAHFAHHGPWREKKAGADEALALVDTMRDAGVRPRDVQRALREFYKDAEKAGTIDPSVLPYHTVLDNWRVVTTTTMSNSRVRPNLCYDVTDPATGKVYPSPERGWVCSRETMDQWLASGRAAFRENTIHKVLDLRDSTSLTPRSVFKATRAQGTRVVADLLGVKDQFPFPKNVEVLAHWFNIVAGPDAAVLDFFAGSGSTAHAVMVLNAADRGSRTSVSVTNNEVGDADRATLADTPADDPQWDALGVFNKVTRPRLTAAVTGVRADGKPVAGTIPAPYNQKMSAGMHTRVEFYRLTPDVDDQ